MRFTPSLAALLSLVSSAWADVAVPFHSRAPLDIVFEVDRDYPDHQFYLMTYGRVEPLAVSPGQTLTAKVAGPGDPRRVWIVAASRDVAKQLD
jgi:hypothetical protein